MSTDFSHLLSPIRIGTQTYKNRLEVAPLGGVEFNADGSFWRERTYEAIDSRVFCGAAAYLLGETAVSMTGGRGPHQYYDFYNLSPEHMAPYVEIADYIHSYGSKALVELCHVGEAKEDPGMPTWGPMEFTKPNGIHVHGMTEEDIRQCCDDFAQAAFFMKEAGYDGVLIHAGHGWLFTQFLSPRTNQRTDRYGGSLENRARFSVEVMRAIRERCGEDFVIEARISGREHAENGYSDDDICRYAQEISPYIDLIHVSAGLYRDPMRTWQESTPFLPHACNADIAAMIKKAVNIPVSVVGGINSPEQAEELIASGQVDMVALCRQLKADPLWLEKAKNGHPEEIRRCLRCMRCFPGPFEEAMAELQGNFPMGCSINPYSEYPEGLHPQQADAPKNVLVIGGGPAGMQAAITAAERGHRVTLAERTAQFGGILNYAESVPEKYDLFLFGRTLKAIAENRGVRMMSETEGSAQLLDELKPDVVILAVGSSQATPMIQGIDNPNVIDSIQAYDPDREMGRSIVVLGGGIVGCETAIHLARSGKKVTLVAKRGVLAPDAYRLYKHQLWDFMKDEVPHILNSQCIRIDPDGAVVRNADGLEQKIQADTIVNAMGRTSNATEDLITMCRERGIDCAAIGDCKQPGKLYEAVIGGYLTAASL